MSVSCSPYARNSSPRSGGDVEKDGTLGTDGPRVQKVRCHPAAPAIPLSRRLPCTQHNPSNVDFLTVRRVLRSVFGPHMNYASSAELRGTQAMLVVLNLIAGFAFGGSLSQLRAPTDGRPWGLAPSVRRDIPAAHPADPGSDDVWRLRDGGLDDVLAAPLSPSGLVSGHVFDCRETLPGSEAASLSLASPPDGEVTVLVSAPTSPVNWRQEGYGLDWDHFSDEILVLSGPSHIPRSNDDDLDAASGRPSSSTTPPTTSLLHRAQDCAARAADPNLTPGRCRCSACEVHLDPPKASPYQFTEPAALLREDSSSPPFEVPREGRRGTEAQPSVPSEGTSAVASCLERPGILVAGTAALPLIPDVIVAADYSLPLVAQVHLHADAGNLAREATNGAAPTNAGHTVSAERSQTHLDAHYGFASTRRIADVLASLNLPVAAHVEVRAILNIDSVSDLCLPPFRGQVFTQDRDVPIPGPGECHLSRRPGVLDGPRAASPCAGASSPGPFGDLLASCRSSSMVHSPLRSLFLEASSSFKTMPQDLCVFQ